jgi:Resolvase, N terminal domain
LHRTPDIRAQDFGHLLRVEAFDCPVSSSAAPGRVAVPDGPGPGGRPIPQCPVPARAPSREGPQRPGPAAPQAGVGWTELPPPAAADTAPAGHVRIGYARASTVRQSLDTQVDSLRASGVTRILSEKISTRAVTRPELDRAVALVLRVTRNECRTSLLVSMGGAF